MSITKKGHVEIYAPLQSGVTVNAPACNIYLHIFFRPVVLTTFCCCHCHLILRNMQHFLLFFEGMTHCNLQRIRLRLHEINPNK